MVRLVSDEKIESIVYSLSLIPKIVDWNTQTFPDATLEEQEKKFKQEMRGVEEQETKLMLEIADCFIAASGMARFNENKSKEYLSFLLSLLDEKRLLFLPGAIIHKMNINKSREKWVKDENGVYHHVEEETKNENGRN